MGKDVVGQIYRKCVYTQICSKPTSVILKPAEFTFAKYGSLGFMIYSGFGLVYGLGLGLGIWGFGLVYGLGLGLGIWWSHIGAS